MLKNERTLTITMNGPIFTQPLPYIICSFDTFPAYLANISNRTIIVVLCVCVYSIYCVFCVRVSADFLSRGCCTASSTMHRWKWTPSAWSARLPFSLWCCYLWWFQSRVSAGRWTKAWVLQCSCCTLCLWPCRWRSSTTFWCAPFSEVEVDGGRTEGRRTERIRPLQRHDNTQFGRTTATPNITNCVYVCSQ